MKRDFLHTISVLISSALAEHEIRTLRPDSKPIPRSFSFEVLAAATEARRLMPGQPLLSSNGELSLTLEERDEELWLHVQANGYASMTECADQDARIYSGNGSIDYTTRFNNRGTAVCVLKDTAEIREGLSDLKVELLPGE